MAKSRVTTSKKDKEKQRKRVQVEKREKMAERKANREKGKSLEEMMAYIDEEGNISSVPPDGQRRKPVHLEDIVIGRPRMIAVEDPVKSGKVDYFDGAKGFGFILQQDGTKVFFHINQTSYAARKGDMVNYTLERGPKGWFAAGVSHSSTSM